MITREVPRLQGLSKNDLAEHLTIKGFPLIISNEVQRWPASERWSLQFFAREFGEFPVVAAAPQFLETAVYAVRMTLSAYIAYLMDPTAALVTGSWIKGDASSLLSSELTLYAGDFNPAHWKFGRPELVFQDVPKLPGFVDSWLDLLDADFRTACERIQSHHFVYLSAPGAVTPMHQDFWGTHAFLAQILGRKKVLLVAPEVMQHVDSNLTSSMPAWLTDSRLACVEGWVCELKPGELLVVPSRWYHYVETVETSITYSADWVDQSNWKLYVERAKAAIALRRKKSAAKRFSG